MSVINSSNEKDTETLVLRICEEVLGRTGVVAEDDFFSIGGDSVAAMHMIGRLRHETGLELRVRLLFEHPVLGALAQCVSVNGEPESATDKGDPRAQLRASFMGTRAPGRTER